MSDVHPIEKELIGITKLKPKEKEGQDRFLKRVVRKAHALDDDIWDSLQEETQLWLNAAIIAVNEKKDLPLFDADLEPDDKKPGDTDEGEEDTDADEGEEDTDAEEEDDEEGDEPESKKPKKKKEDKKGATTSARKPRKLNVDGVGFIIKATLASNPNATRDDILSALKEKGKTCSDSYLDVMRSDVKHTLRVLEELGLYTPPSDG